MGRGCSCQWFWHSPYQRTVTPEHIFANNRLIISTKLHFFRQIFGCLAGITYLCPQNSIKQTTMERQSIAVMAIGSMLLAVYLLTTACTDNYDNASQQPMADGQIPITFIVDDTQDWYQTGGATYEKPKNGNCPFYKWGRKDPMRGFRECGMTTPTRKTYYDHNGYSWDVIWSASSIGTSIKNPHKFISANDNTYGHWYSYPNYPTDDLCNSWNAGISSVGQPWYAYDKVIKTIYDPCPVGFHIPTPYIYLGFLNVHWIEDTKSTSSSEWEGSYSATDKAWSFYTDGTRRNEFYMPLTGYYTDKAVAESTCFFEWFAYSGAAYFGPFAQLGKGDFIMPYNSKGWTGYAIACRPQAEEDW